MVPMELDKMYLLSMELLMVAMEFLMVPILEDLPFSMAKKTNHIFYPPHLMEEQPILPVEDLAAHALYLLVLVHTKKGLSFHQDVARKF